MKRSDWFGGLRSSLGRKRGKRRHKAIRYRANRRATFETLEDRRLLAVDFGDAPDIALGTGPGNYNTLSTDNGAQHTIVVGLRMGANVDGDGGALQNATATADDVNGALPDDEDGLVNPAADLVLTIGAQPTVNLRVTNTTGATATLHGWIDYNADGVFDNSTERASVSVLNNSVNVIRTLVFPAVPQGSTGTTFARFRLSTDSSASNPTGAALDGEVEDYRVSITTPTSGLVDSSKTKKIASSTNGGPTLANSDYFGRSVAAIGDIDGDGVTDLAVGAHGDDAGGSGRGAVHVLLMNSNGTVKGSSKINGTTFVGSANGDYFGSSVASLGDLDGDGVADLAIGAERNELNGVNNRGGLYIVFLNSNGSVKDYEWLVGGFNGMPPSSDGDYLGHAVASIGDLDGDGVTDLAIGAPGNDTGGANRGSVQVLFMNANGTGKSSLRIASGLNGSPTLANSDYFGSSVASLGDLDGDGITDLAVGAIYDDTGGSNRGAVHVLFMNSNGTVKSFQKIAGGVGGGPTLADGDQFGASLAAVGDLDGDGVTDIAVGANYDDTNGTSRGAIYLLNMNADGTVKASQKIASGVGGGPMLANDDRLGVSVASLGDLDGDGLTDLAVGANFDDAGGINRGAVYTLFLQAPPSNSNPIITSSDAVSVPENSTNVMIVTATDAEAPPQVVSFSIVGGADADKFSITGGGVLTFVAPPNFEAPADANGDNVYVVTVQASDGAGGLATQTISVTVTAQNDGVPVFTSPNTFNVAENTSAIATVTAIDSDLPPDSITYSIVGGADQSRFMITSGGELSFVQPPDYEMPWNRDRGVHFREVPQFAVAGFKTTDVLINFNGFLRGQQMILNLTQGSIYQDPFGSNTSPNGAFFPLAPTVEFDTYVTVGGRRSDGPVPPASQPVLVVGGAVDLQPGSALKFDTQGLNIAWAPGTGIDVDGGTDYITSRITLSNDAVGTLHYFGSTGGDSGPPWVMQDIPIVNGSIDNFYQVVVQASDGKGGLSTQTISVNVTPVNDNAPAFTSADAVNIPENSTSVMTVHATDADLPSQSLTYSIVGGADQTKFSITSGGALSFVSSPDFESPADANGDNLYFVTVRADDGAGQTTDQTISVSVNPLNDNVPIFTSSSTVSVVERSTVLPPVTAMDADLPAQSVTFSIVGGADQSKLTVSSGGTLSFITAPQFLTPTDANGDNVYVVSVQASDGNGGTATQTINVTVTSATDLGDAPDASGGTGSGNYNTRFADNGPSHSIVPGLKLGANVDGDSGTLQNANANADNTSGALPIDEDGLVNPAADLVLTSGTQPTVNVRVTNTTGAPATLYGWIDYDANGVFSSATERASVLVPNGTNNGIVTLVFPEVPEGFTGTTYARFRLSSDPAAASSTGAAVGGEVEDYRVSITQPSSGRVDPAKSKKLASGINGTPALANADAFGNAAVSIGDLNGDGIQDLAVGAQSVSAAGGNGGAVHILFMNADGTVQSSQKIASGIGGGPSLTLGDYFGRSIAAIGDLDGDGVGDLAVGADRDGTGGALRGAVYVLLMNSNGTVKGFQKIAHNTGGGPTLANLDRFGGNVTSLGDLDGDGVTDLAVGASGDKTGGTNRGAVYVLFMNSNGTVKSLQKIASGLNGAPALANGDYFGGALAGLGDLDGDGVTDLAAGAWGDDTGGAGRGAMYVLFLNSNGSVKNSQKIAQGVGGGPSSLATNDFFGSSLAALGDLDGDGVADLAVGARYDDTGGPDRGAIYVQYMNANGTVKGSQKIASGTGGGPTVSDGDVFGRAIGSLGDLDGDGVTDLAVGAERDDTGGTNRGAVHVLFLKEFNHTPIITSPDSKSVAENATAVLTVTATDEDLPPQSITFSIVGGADQSQFSITSGGVLTFAAAPDYEAPDDSNTDNVYVVTVEAADSEGGSTTQTISVTVTPENDNSPQFTSSDSKSIPENTTSVLTVTATDADLPAESVSISIVGGADQAKFSLSPAGELSFVSAPNFEAPTDSNGDNIYVVIVQASDGSRTTLQAILVTVTGVNEFPPVFQTSSPISVPENAKPVVTVTATDDDLPAQAISFVVFGGADQAQFTITAGGALSFVNAPDFEAPADANGDNLYEVVVRASDGAGGTAVQTFVISVTDVFEGDYNSDGVVDAADYTVWREKLGQTVPPFSGADGSGNGAIDQADWAVWKANFGKTAPGGGAVVAAVPEPVIEVSISQSIGTEREFTEDSAFADLPAYFMMPSHRTQARRRAMSVQPQVDSDSRGEGLLAWLKETYDSRRAVREEHPAFERALPDNMATFHDCAIDGYGRVGGLLGAARTAGFATGAPVAWQRGK